MKPATRTRAQKEYEPEVVEATRPSPLARLYATAKFRVTWAHHMACPQCQADKRCATLKRLEAMTPQQARRFLAAKATRTREAAPEALARVAVLKMALELRDAGRAYADGVLTEAELCAVWPAFKRTLAAYRRAILAATRRKP